MRPFNSTIFKWGAGFLVLIVVQVTVLKYIAIEVQSNISVQPDLVLILLFFFGLRHSQITSTVTGFAVGLVSDILGGGIIGLTAFAKTVAGYSVGYFPREHKIQKISQFSLLLLVITIIHDVIFNIIYVINTELNFWRIVLLHSLPSSIYTVFIGAIIFYWIKQ